MQNTNLTIDKFSALRNVKIIVKSLVEAPYHMICATTKYSLFKPRKGNRNGLQMDRVNSFIKKIKADKYYPILGHIFIDHKGNIIDGHHRFEAMKREGKPIIFMVVDEMNLNEISDFNSHKSPAWKNNDNFGSAKTMGLELAVVMDDIRVGLLSKYTTLTEKDISIGDMYGILVQEAKYFGSGVKAIVREKFEEKTFVPRARSTEYHDILDAYAQIKTKWVNVHKRYKACKVVMICTFPKNKKAVNFTTENFVNNLSASNFKFREDSGTDDFVREAIRIHNIRRPRNEKAISLIY